MISRACLAVLACLLFSDAASAESRVQPCKTGHVEWSGKPLSEIVANSHTIFMARVSEFVEDTSRPGFDGYYWAFSTGTELKGRPVGKVKIYGLKPYPIPPQTYFDIDARHKELAERHEQHNRVSIPGGIARVTKVGDHCPLAPRFVLGYRYLVMLGTDSTLSFEPIHAGAVRRDAWFAVVEKEIDRQARE